MSNLHTLPDTLHELMCTWGDLGPAVILSHSGLTVPASSLTLAAVAATGYVLATGPPARLVYVSQPAVSITLSGGNGTYWLALHADLSTAVAGWTRRAGSHYVWQMNATQPANPAGALVFCQVTVAGSVITAVSPLLPVTSPPMSKQNSGAVAITGGTATGLTTVNIASNYAWMDAEGFHVLDHSGNNVAGLRATVNSGGGSNRYGVISDGSAPNYFAGNVGIGVVPSVPRVEVVYAPTTGTCLRIKPSVESGSRWALEFLNAASTTIGTIATTSTATAYNTSSDVRLKHAIAPLTDALARVRALRPVAFRWNQDDSSGVGFLAHELQVHIPEAVTGEPDALNEDGSIRPQGVDHSRLVPWLTACCQELAQQVQTLTARITTLEEALGL